MPTSKPVLQAVLDEEYKAKFDRICEIEGRSKSNMTSYIIRQWIDNYESKALLITNEETQEPSTSNVQEIRKQILKTLTSLDKIQP